MYKCGAFNPVTGETVFQSHGTKLTVKSKSESKCWRLQFEFTPSNGSRVCSDLGSSPQVRIVYPTTPVTVSVQRSQPLVLECVVSGSPAPAAKWLRNGQEVTPGALLHRQHNNLAFVAVTMSDAGTYTCTAEAAQGPVAGASYTLDVLGKNGPRMAAMMSRSDAEFIRLPLLRRTGFRLRGPEGPGRRRRLLRSLHLRRQRKPFPERHLAVQR